MISFLSRLAFSLFLMLVNVNGYAATQPSPTDIKLYALDCGRIDLEDGTTFSDIDFYPPGHLKLTDTCFLVHHPKGWLLWDTGLGDQYLNHPVVKPDFGVRLEVPVSLRSQLKQLNLTPEDIQYVAISHSHFDHLGNAALFPHAKWLMQRTEYQEMAPGNEQESLKIIRQAPKELLEGDKDVFGDGTVRILSAPGHTVGHQVLRLLLPHEGVVILSGDLYHTRNAYRFKLIPVHNANRADTLASMARIESILERTKGRLIIQHDSDDFAKLPKFPAYLD